VRISYGYLVVKAGDHKDTLGASCRGVNDLERCSWRVYKSYEFQYVDPSHATTRSQVGCAVLTRLFLVDRAAPTHGRLGSVVRYRNRYLKLYDRVQAFRSRDTAHA
jgi:hypothetical protein